MSEVMESEVVESSTSMVKLDGAVKALAEASSLEDVKHIADVAEAARAYAKAARLGLKAQNRAAEIHLRAQRKAGEMLATMDIHGGDRKSRLHDATLKLSDLGIDKFQSHRWQRIASVSEEEFEAHLEGIRQSNREITTASVLALGRGTTTDVRNESSPRTACDNQWHSLIESGTRFGTIYADPPWDDEHHDSRMTVGQLCSLPVEAIVADSAHLHLWVTDDDLFNAKRIIHAWGFDYTGCFVWVKPKANTSQYWGVGHEFLVLGVRGSCSFLDRSLKSWAEIEQTQDGHKPEAVRQLIERVSPSPRLELFARQQAPGWMMIESGIQCDKEERCEFNENCD